jgi:hypothetical protein
MGTTLKCVGVAIIILLPRSKTVIKKKNTIKAGLL